jgi:hypothetical protein
METRWSNAILLCKSRCQEAYENVLDPGLTFVPTDLRYFIEYEKETFEGGWIYTGNGNRQKCRKVLFYRLRILCASVKLGRTLSR